MIEFKADCGHTVRSKDEDAGKVVRCAYCGREAQVPQDDQDELDFLFSDVDDRGAEATSTGRVRGGDRGTTRPGGRTRVDPFGLVKKMSYVAAVLICLIFVGKKYAWPMFEDAFLGDGSTQPPPPVTVHRPTRTTRRTTPPRPSHRFGLLETRLEGRGNQGVYVNSVPAGATVYYCREKGADTDGYDWLRNAKVTRAATPDFIDLVAGDHTIVVMIPINDRDLKTKYRAFGYDDLRRKVEDSPRRANEAAGSYFRPDEATDVKIIRMGGRVNIARRYDVNVEIDSWSVLTPQFLPYDCQMKDVTKLVPKRKAYGFDEDELMSDFDFYEVIAEDRNYMVDILHSIGTISYRQPDGSFRMFKIDPLDGMISAPQLEGVHRAPPGIGSP